MAQWKIFFCPKLLLALYRNMLHNKIYLKYLKAAVHYVSCRWNGGGSFSKTDRNIYAFTTFNEIFSLKMGHSSEKGSTNNREKLRIGCNFTDWFYTEKYDDSSNMSLNYSKLRPIWRFTFFLRGFCGKKFLTKFLLIFHTKSQIW